MKKNLIRVLTVIGLFLPTIIAIIVLACARSAPTSIKTISSLTLSSPDGSRVYAYDRSTEDGIEKINELWSLHENASKASSLPDQLADVTPYKMEVVNYDKSSTYLCYFKADAQDAYLVEEDGKVLKLAEKDTKAFLSGTYAEGLFPESAPARLMIQDKEILPSEMNWFFRNAAGEFAEATVETAKEEIPALASPGKPVFDFSLAPDFLNIKVTSGGNVVFDGLYENLAGTLDNLSGNAEITLNAKWYEDNARSYRGESTYVFPLSFSLAPTFYLGTSQIEQGEFVVITGKNVADESAIEFSSQPDIAYTPVFFREGDFVYALVPLSLDLKETGEYVFTLKSGITSQQMKLNVTPRAPKATVTYTIDANTVNKTRTAQTINEFNTAMAPIAANRENTRYFGGLFLEALPGHSILLGFGRERKLSGTGETYTHIGVDYIVKNGESVVAANAGKIIYVGEQTLSGKLVVIDHGLGLKSWYAHLSEASVKVGDVVKTGDTIGKTGNSGFTNGYNCHYSLTVFDIPVCPYSLWEADKNGNEGVLIFTPES